MLRDKLKLLYYRLRWFFVGDVYITRINPEDFETEVMEPRTPRQIADELNSQEPTDERKHWEASDGWHAVIAVERIDNQVVFNPGNGIALKTFYNQATGEMKFFWAKQIEGDNIYH